MFGNGFNMLLEIIAFLIIASPVFLVLAMLAFYVYLIFTD
jgi:hypothetical protein